jgi:membrane-associated phospholipid phosphatase
LVFEFVVMSFRAGWAAFPSGHATTATACAVALATALPRQAFAWLSVGLIAALSRAFIGVHWLTDCLAGIALGALVSIALRRRMEKSGHAFQIDPTLPAKVLVKGGLIFLSDAWRLVASLVRQAKGRVRRHVQSWRS